MQNIHYSPTVSLKNQKKSQEILAHLLMHFCCIPFSLIFATNKYKIKSLTFNYKTILIKMIQTTVDTSCCSCSTDHSPTESKSKFATYSPAVVSLVMLVIGIVLDNLQVPFLSGWVQIVWYVIAYLPVGLPVLKQGWDNILKGDFFTEFFLMGIATIGAFALGHYHEGVAVMLFYSVGELFQHAAVDKSTRNIKALLDVRPNVALVFRDNQFTAVHPAEVFVGEKVQVRNGESIPLDGVLLSDSASLNTAAITGESVPVSSQKNDAVYAGSINMGGVIEVETTKIFEDSSIAKILHLVQEATSRKSKTELFIRKFARVYTPIVVFAALALTFLPFFFVENYVFGDWLYRALIFLVISCPCALVISIPLGYFGGLGAASQNGILFKGASYLDAITKINTVVMDKTGTLTQGVFKIKDIKTYAITEADFMEYLMAMEAQSTHPLAAAVLEYAATPKFLATDIEEIAGEGLKGNVNNKIVLAGNKKLMERHGIAVPTETDSIEESIILAAIDGEFAGYITVSDELKEDAFLAIKQLRKLGVSNIVMLSGDRPAIAEKVGRELKLDQAKGGLLPEDKLKEVERLMSSPDVRLAFAGDGINDAPALATSDVGIAMGGLGSDLAIETADIVIQTDQPSRIARAIKIGKSTRQIVWQNIALAFGVKFIVLLMGASGIATMWEAVFADVGVAFLAILNAIRLQRMKWD